MSEIRKEFDSFCSDEAICNRERRLMRISAKWMAERCAKVTEESRTTNWMCADQIRQLSKELDHE